MKNILAVLSGFLLTACSHMDTSPQGDEALLYKYAYSSCLFWYFKSQGYDIEDIGAINGGLVEKSNVGIDKFQEISLYLKNSSPKLVSKNEINPDLNKCFHLESDAFLREIISNH